MHGTGKDGLARSYLNSAGGEPNCKLQAYLFDDDDRLLGHAETPQRKNDK